MSNTREILIASREGIDALVPRLNVLLDLAAPLTIRTMRGEGTAASMSWQIAEGPLAEGTITLQDTEGIELNAAWPITEDAWKRYGWCLSIEVRHRPPEAYAAFTQRVHKFALKIMTCIGEGLSVSCVALDNFQTTLGSYPAPS